jgi:hypothetical protein
MRILRGTHRQVVITVSPSEPMLAIAAADALNDTIKIYQEAIKTLVDQLILRGLVLDRGMQSELCTRLLFTLARDRAVQPIVQSSPMAKVQAVSLSQFLCTLLGDDVGINDKKLRNDLISALSKFWINFTHFVQLSEAVTQLTPDWLLEAWSSGIAFQCAPLQPVIDGFLVCYKGNLDESFDIRNLTIVPWQTKARSKAASATLVDKLTAPPIVQTDGRRCKTHPLVIFMDLGVSAQIRRDHSLVDLTYTASTPPTRRTWDGYARDGEEEPKRYCLKIRGNGSSTYHVMKGFDAQLDPLFQRLLVCADVNFTKFLDTMNKNMQRCALEEE